jgi:hypothetical protein
MNLPSRSQAEAYLAEAAQINPGPWEAHSRLTAQAAEAIAAHHPELDPDNAYILGLLHDIGRREGVFGLRHTIDGYNFLNQQGYPDAARVCLTHSFPTLDINTSTMKPDCTPEQQLFLKQFLATVKLDLYDLLVQLCDSIALPTGFCLMETRLMDVALRYGVNQHSVSCWKTYLGIKQQFETTIGQSIYALLPGELTHLARFSI